MNELEENGVVLLRDVIGYEIDQVRAEYDRTEPLIGPLAELPNRPVVVLWKHVVGEQKRVATLLEFPVLWFFITDCIVPVLRQKFPERTKKLQLLETIIFDKPPGISNTLNWHQDVAYFPLKPNNQLAVWIPFEPVTQESGAMVYALGSHKLGVRGSTDLHTRAPFSGEARVLIPDSPASEGFEERCFEMAPTDMLVHDGYTWHYSGPNTVPASRRRGLSVRFITEPAAFDPRPGQGAAFTKQISVQPGEIVKGAPFPDL